MLQSLHVKNIALIDEVEIDFTKGLNILTGETGAGKSIIIDSVNFALGAKVPKGVVRDDADYAICELVFDVANPQTIEKIKSLDVVMEDSQVILQRKIVNGKSSSKINGENVTASTLRQIAEVLIDIHGQHEHQSLLYKKNHKLMLDSFCGSDFEEKLCKLKDTYTRYRDCERKYEEALKASDTRIKDLDYSMFVVNEIESANLRDGEDDELEERFSKMNSSKTILESLSGIENIMSTSDASVSSQISYALSLLKPIASYDDTTSELMDTLATMEDIAGDFARQLSDYAEGLSFSPEDYEDARVRLDEINRLKMKYGQSIEEILNQLEVERKNVSRLQDYEEYLASLEVEKTELYGILTDVCAQISDIRKREAEVLSKDIVSALKNLNFLDVKFEIEINSSEENISKDGYDDVEFMIALNPGEKLRPLTMVASGGELSRIMLALKSVLAKRDIIDTLIFDEIDTGISGKTAQLVADQMADIAGTRQVICVTHLPQIASHATTHFLIEKSAKDNHTSTNISKLSYDESVSELARMLAGGAITEAVMKNAAELKKEFN